MCVVRLAATRGSNVEWVEWLCNRGKVIEEVNVVFCEGALFVISTEKVKKKVKNQKIKSRVVK